MFRRVSNCFVLLIHLLQISLSAVMGPRSPLTATGGWFVLVALGSGPVLCFVVVSLCRLGCLVIAWVDTHF